MKHQFAPIEWDDKYLGSPYSENFHDIYFSPEDGIAETRYVFLQGNELSQKEFSSLCIGETGFGTGLNFLVTLMQENIKELSFFSFEQYPLSLTDLKRCYENPPLKKEIPSSLLDLYFEKIYPALLDEGSFKGIFNERKFEIKIYWGDINESILVASNENKADAWFLDGFSPKENAAMWSPLVIKNIARLSHKGSSLATFTSAGFVRRLLSEQGFSMKKMKGFGKKREMLTGLFHEKNEQ